MEDPLMSSPTNKALFFIDLSEQNSSPTIPSQFIANNFNGKIQSTKIKLTSDASDRTWKVELDGKRFSEGWKDFSAFHCVRDNDVLSFRHEGDMVFHVTPFGRSFSQLHLISSSNHDEEDDEHNSFDDDDDDDDDEDYSEKISSKKKARMETESSNSYLLAHVTNSSLSRDTMCLLRKFARSNNLERKHCEIDLMNEHGKSWTLLLQHQKQSGRAYIRRGWRSFCRNNGIKVGSFCRFKLVQNGVKPVLQLCPGTSSIPEENTSKANQNGNVSEDFAENVPLHQNKIVTLLFKPYMLLQFRLPASFTRENLIMEEGEVTIVNKNGVEWKLHLVNIKGRDQFYIRGCKEFFVANNIKNDGESFTVEAIQGGTSPILKICSKVKEASSDGYKTQERKPLEEETENRVQKKARVFEEGGPSRQTRASNKSSAEPGNLERKQELESRSISDHVKEMKEVIENTLTDMRRIRSEVEVKEQNLQISLDEIEALEVKIMGISKVFNVNQV